MNEKHVYIVTGPTASGKSDYALSVAKEHNGVIINADSMQLYKEAPILTAQPNEASRQGISHRLYGILDADDPCSVARWVSMASREIKQAWSQSKAPVLVGGTGLYIKALIEGMVEIPEIDEDIRHDVRQMNAVMLRSALENEDRVMAFRLLPTDTQRMARALEVIRSTGRSLADWQLDAASPPLPDAAFIVKYMQLDRDKLYDRINIRFNHMVDKGAVEEANKLHAMQLPKTLPLMRAVGVAEMLSYVENKVSLDEAVDLAKMNSRRYAKRQLTWIRHQLHAAQPIDALDMTG